MNPAIIPYRSHACGSASSSMPLTLTLSVALGAPGAAWLLPARAPACSAPCGRPRGAPPVSCACQGPAPPPCRAAAGPAAPAGLDSEAHAHAAAAVPAPSTLGLQQTLQWRPHDPLLPAAPAEGLGASYPAQPLPETRLTLCLHLMRRR